MNQIEHLLDLSAENVGQNQNKRCSNAYNFMYFCQQYKINNFTKNQKVVATQKLQNDLKFATCNFFIYINNYNINIILKKGRYEKNNIKVIGFDYVIKI